MTVVLSIDFYTVISYAPNSNIKKPEEWKFYSFSFSLSYPVSTNFPYIFQARIIRYTCWSLQSNKRGFSMKQ